MFTIFTKNLPTKESNIIEFYTQYFLTNLLNLLKTVRRMFIKITSSTAENTFSLKETFLYFLLFCNYYKLLNFSNVKEINLISCFRN